MDLQAAAIQQVGALLFVAQEGRSLQQILLDRLGVVGRLGGVGRNGAHALGHLPGRTQQRPHERCHQSDVTQPFGDLAEPRSGSFGVTDRVEARRRPDQSCQERSLDHRQFADALAEVDLGGSLQSVGVVAEEHRVEIALEDGVFAHLLLEHRRVVRLKALVTPISWQPGQKLVLDDLLADRARALSRSVAGEVAEQRSGEAAEVDTVVEVELLVFDSEESVQHLGRDLGEGDRLAVLALEHGDDVADDVVDVASLRQRLELGQRHRQLVMGVGDAPQSRSDGDDDGGREQCSGNHDRTETEEPSQETHADSRLVARRSRSSAPGSLRLHDYAAPVQVRSTGVHGGRRGVVDCTGPQGRVARLQHPDHARPLR